MAARIPRHSPALFPLPRPRSHVCSTGMMRCRPLRTATPCRHTRTHTPHTSPDAVGIAVVVLLSQTCACVPREVWLLWSVGSRCSLPPSCPARVAPCLGPPSCPHLDTSLTRLLAMFPALRACTGVDLWYRPLLCTSPIGLSYRPLLYTSVCSHSYRPLE